MSLPELLTEGDRVPFLCGAFADGTFFSTESFAGRTLIILSGDGVAPDVQHTWLRAFQHQKADLMAAEGDFVMLLSMDALSMSAHLNPPTPGVVIVQPDMEISCLGSGRGHPMVWVLDRVGRVVRCLGDPDPVIAAELALQEARRKQCAPGRRRHSTPPLLMVPHILSRDMCHQLIDVFEAGDHRTGGMASIDEQGRAVLKIEDSKKRRRDLELVPGMPLYGEVVSALSLRLVPEIAKAFNVQVAHADRILIARYDDTGGYFHRHRDNAAPQVAFRQFAVSLNLNSDDYEGGELEFPEFDNDFYLPATGAAAVFSASLLHAARPVTRGCRYVLLTFLHDHAAERLRQDIEGRVS
jgi:predicted 2-oxoglutarate/Fe(II)-dependent dioxygenase YbiX